MKSRTVATLLSVLLVLHNVWFPFIYRKIDNIDNWRFIDSWRMTSSILMVIAIVWTMWLFFRKSKWLRDLSI